jgi:hypothetical protein
MLAAHIGEDLDFFFRLGEDDLDENRLCVAWKSFDNSYGLLVCFIRFHS